MKNVELLIFNEGNPIFLEIEKLRLNPLKFRFNGRLEMFKRDLKKIIDEQILELKKLAQEDILEFKSVNSQNKEVLDAIIKELTEIEKRRDIPYWGWFSTMNFQGNTLPIYTDYRVRIQNELYNEINIASKYRSELENESNEKISSRQKLIVFYKYFIEPGEKEKKLLIRPKKRQALTYLLFGGPISTIATTLKNLESCSECIDISDEAKDVLQANGLI